MSNRSLQRRIVETFHNQCGSYPGQRECFTLIRHVENFLDSSEGRTLNHVRIEGVSLAITTAVQEFIEEAAAFAQLRLERVQRQREVFNLPSAGAGHDSQQRRLVSRHRRYARRTSMATVMAA
jgi:hypothetical protein